MGTGTQTQVSCKSSWCSSPWVLCSASPSTSWQGTWPLTTSRWENNLTTILLASTNIVGYMIRDRTINLWEELSRMASRAYSLGLSSGDCCLAMWVGIARFLFKEWMGGVVASEEHKEILCLGWNERSMINPTNSVKNTGKLKTTDKEK